MELTYLWLLAAALLLMHQYQAFTFPATGPTAEEGPAAQLAHRAHRREKRCSCENQKDKECIFFCHIGIVWVNTPSHVVPYGFGPVRLRRDVQRCVCADSQDAKCRSFCSAGMQARVPSDRVKRSTNQWLQRQHRAALWEKRSRHALGHQT